MRDETTTRVPWDPNYIRLWDPVEVAHWCTKFRCTEGRLRQAVHAAGESVAAVEAWFQKRKVAQQVERKRDHGREL